MKNFIKKVTNRFRLTEDKLTAESIFTDWVEIDQYDISCEYPKIKLENIDFDFDKDSVLIIDDNEGMVSFLEDDIEFLAEHNLINQHKINILGISGDHAAFTFKTLQDEYGSLNIKWAIIDITLGGSKMTEKGNLKYSGVDVFKMIYDKNPDVKFLFYTGNSLNPYINANKNLIAQFKSINGDDIMSHVLFKTSMDMDKRRKYISKILFGESILYG